MRTKILLSLATLVILVLAAGGILYAVGVLRAPELEGVTLSWGEVTEQTTTVNADIEVNNRLPFGLGSGSIGIQAPVYFYGVEAAQFDLPSLSLPHGRSTLHAYATMVQANLPEWWPDFVQQGEVLAIHVQPRVTARVLGIPLSTGLPDVQTEVHIPIMSNLSSAEPITMGFDDASLLEIAQNPGEHFKVSPPTPARPILTVESWELHWGNVTTETTQILGSVVLRNELAVSVPIQGLRLGLDMNDIGVIPDIKITSAQSELPPGQSVPLALEANVDNGKFVQWWTSHLQHGENTIVTARIGVTIILPVTSGLGLTEPVPLPLIPVPVFECNVTTDIMGVANYEIAQMLGKAAGPEPEAFKVEQSVQPPQLGSTGPWSIGRIYRLSTSVDPLGAGTVIPSSGNYLAGTPVILTAALNPLQYAFSHWSGDLSGTTNPITITMDSDKSVTAHFTAALQLILIQVSPASASIATGQTQQFTAAATYSDGSTADITNFAIWTSSSPSVAMVVPGGLAIGLFPGTADITATVGTVQGSASLTVTLL